MVPVSVLMMKPMPVVAMRIMALVKMVGNLAMVVMNAVLKMVMRGSRLGAGYKGKKNSNHNKKFKHNARPTLLSKNLPRFKK